jgi:hypothetical protein
MLTAASKSPHACIKPASFVLAFAATLALLGTFSDDTIAESPEAAEAAATIATERIRLDGSSRRSETPESLTEDETATAATDQVNDFEDPDRLLLEPEEEAEQETDMADEDEQPDSNGSPLIDRMFSTDTRNLRVNIAETSAEAPRDRSAEVTDSIPLSLETVREEKVYAWAAPDIRYQPLYFEDVALERYGQTPCGLRQTVLSGIHFFSSAALLGFQKLDRHPCDCDWPLGFCRPGSDVPFVWQTPIAR